MNLNDDSDSDFKKNIDYYINATNGLVDFLHTSKELIVPVTNKSFLPYFGNKLASIGINMPQIYTLDDSLNSAITNGIETTSFFRDKLLFVENVCLR